MSTGQINIVSNLVLKKIILSLYKRYEEIATHIKEINEFSTQQYAKMVDKHVKYRPSPVIIWDKETMFNQVEWEYINQPFTDDFRMLETTFFMT